MLLVIGGFLGRLLCSPFNAVYRPHNQETACPSSKPQIQFVSLPAYSDVGGSASEGTISGRVSGVDPTCCKVVIYSFTNTWWVQPQIGSVTPIHSDGVWSEKIHLGSKYAALLVNSDYKPQSQLETLPAVDGSVLAIEIK
jgi:hypothetical protein